MVQHQHQHDDMIKKIFLILCLCLLSNITLANEGEPVFNPCGLNGLQRDGLTSYFYYKFSAQHKDLSLEETQYFLKSIEQEDSRISNVRIFKSPHRDGYAIIASYLFQNFLGGEVLVELYCIERVNKSPVLYVTEEGLRKFIGKSYDEVR
jgi:hypothetical protein